MLARLEYVETSGRAQQIDNGTITIARTYDGDHMRAIQWHLFQDVYEWAGQYRRVNIFKGPGRSFGDVLTGELDRYLHDIHQLITHTPWSQLGRHEFVDQARPCFAYVNQAHPFREGNGRTLEAVHATRRQNKRLSDSITPASPPKCGTKPQPSTDQTCTLTNPSRLY